MPIRFNWYNIVQVLSLLPYISTWLFYPLLERGYWNLLVLLVLFPSVCYVYVCVSCSVVSNSATPWTIAHQAPWSMGFSRKEYWTGLSRPSPRYLPNSGIKPRSPSLQRDFLPSEPPGKPLVLISVYSLSIFAKYI